MPPSGRSCIILRRDARRGGRLAGRWRRFRRGRCRWRGGVRRIGGASRGAGSCRRGRIGRRRGGGRARRRGGGGRGFWCNRILLFATGNSCGSQDQRKGELGGYIQLFHGDLLGVVLKRILATPEPARYRRSRGVLVGLVLNVVAEPGPSSQMRAPGARSHARLKEIIFFHRP